MPPLESDQLTQVLGGEISPVLDRKLLLEVLTKAVSLHATDTITVLRDAQTDLFEERRRLTDPTKLTQLSAASTTDQLLNLSKQIQARIIASKTLGSSEDVNSSLFSAVIEDFEKYLHVVTALVDATSLGKLTIAQADDYAALYEARASVCERINLKAAGLKREADEAKRLGEGKATFLSLSKKNDESITGLVIRAIPVEPTENDDIGGLLYVATLGAHIEPAVQQLLNGIPMWTRRQYLYELTESQPFRDYIATTFAPLLKAFVQGREVQAYDPLFRNCYFTVVQYLMKYYREHGEELKAEAAAMAAAQPQPEAQPQGTAQNAPDAPRDVLAPAEAPVAQPGNKTLLELAQGPQANGAVAVNGQAPAGQPAPTPTEPTPAVPPTNPEQPGQQIPVQTQTRKVKPIDVS